MRIIIKKKNNKMYIFSCFAWEKKTQFTKNARTVIQFIKTTLSEIIVKYYVTYYTQKKIKFTIRIVLTNRQK